jgi:hypothetical protein
MMGAAMAMAEEGDDEGDEQRPCQNRYGLVQLVLKTSAYS